MTYFTADSYINYTIEKQFEENGRMYAIASCECEKCGGNGKIAAYAAIDSGICYNCFGSGVQSKKIRLYTESEKKALDKRKQANAEKREKEAIAKANDKIKYWKEKEGFSLDDYTYVVVGDTYNIKDELKKAGAKYNRTLGWHFNAESAYQTVKISFDDCAIVINKFGDVSYRDDFNIRNYIPEEEVDEGEYLDVKENERIYDLEAIYINSFEFKNQFGYCFFHKFKVMNSEIIWSSSIALDLKQNTPCSLTGTVKKFQEYKGIKQTWLTRCKVKI